MTPRELLIEAGSAAAMLLLPLLAAQGLWVRRRTPVFDGAAGPDSGLVEGSGAPLRLALFGESTVAGVGAPDHRSALAGRLADELGRGSGRAVNWRAIGKSGLTVAQGREQLVGRLGAEPVDLLVIVFGVNDALEFHSSARWTTDLSELLAAVRARVGSSRVALSAVPPLQTFPAFPQPLRAALGLRAAALDAAARRWASASGVVYCPARLEGSAAPLFCADGFHPSPLGYAVWASQLARTLAPLMAR